MSQLTAQQALAMLQQQGAIEPTKSMTEKFATFTSNVSDDWSLAKQRADKQRKLRWVQLVLEEGLTPPKDIKADVMKMLALMSKE